MAMADAFELKPHKDRLFAYPDILEMRHGGRYRIVDYREQRDINRRDQTPERRVRSDYVKASVNRAMADLVLETAAGSITHYAVGKQTSARVIVVYLHGQGGNRRQGVNDWTFGGNFNRIKALMADNGGLFLSPDFSDFGAKGLAQVKALLVHYSAASPGAAVIVACGSAGGQLCHALARDGEIGGKLGGILLLGSLWDDGFVGSKAFKARVPLFIGHGSRDTVFSINGMEAFFDSILTAVPNYPVMMVRFETGTHGTPIRMSDWREAINWMLSKR